MGGVGGGGGHGSSLPACLCPTSRRCPRPLIDGGSSCALGKLSSPRLQSRVAKCPWQEMQSVFHRELLSESGPCLQPAKCVCARRRRRRPERRWSDVAAERRADPLLCVCFHASSDPQLRREKRSGPVSALIIIIVVSHTALLPSGPALLVSPKSER